MDGEALENRIKYLNKELEEAKHLLSLFTERNDGKLVINPPNFISFGNQIDPINGEFLGTFFLPFNDENGATIVIIDKYNIGIEKRIIRSILRRWHSSELILMNLHFINLIGKNNSDVTLKNSKGVFNIIYSDSKIKFNQPINNFIEMETMKSFELGNSSTLHGELIKVHLIGMGFMPDDIFLIKTDGKGIHQISNESNDE